MIIGITGPIGSGKGRVAEFFHKKGFVHHSFSGEIRAIAKERGIEINRKNLIKLGQDLRKESPHRSIIGQNILDNINKDIAEGAQRFVIEGIRDEDEINLFRHHEFESKKMRFILIGVDAPQEMRFERMKSRKRQGDPKTFREFKQIDDAEIRGDGGQEVSKCMKMADYTIKNDGTLKELEKKLQDMLSEIL